MITPEDFLKLAEKLVSDLNNEEIVYRTAISRAYYYAFHFVRENCGTHPDAMFRYDHTDHQEAVNFFMRVGRRDLASIMRSLRNRRNHADYELTRTITKDQAEEFINDVRDFIANLKCSGLIMP